MVAGASKGPKRISIVDSCTRQAVSNRAAQPRIKELGSPSELPVRHIKGMFSGSNCKVLAVRFQALRFACEIEAANVKMQPHSHHHEMQVG